MNDCPICKKELGWGYDCLYKCCDFCEDPVVTIYDLEPPHYFVDLEFEDYTFSFSSEHNVVSFNKQLPPSFQMKTIMTFDNVTLNEFLSEEFQNKILKYLNF